MPRCAANVIRLRLVWVAIKMALLRPFALQARYSLAISSSEVAPNFMLLYTRVSPFITKVGARGRTSYSPEGCCTINSCFYNPHNAKEAEKLQPGGSSGLFILTDTAIHIIFIRAVTAMASTALCHQLLVKYRLQKNNGISIRRLMKNSVDYFFITELLSTRASRKQSLLCLFVICLKMVYNHSYENSLFRGRFRPFHSEHEEIANAAICELSLDRLILVPTQNSPIKKTPLPIFPTD